MKNTKLFCLLAMSIAALLMTSCAPGPQNTNTTSNANRSVADTGQTTEPTIAEADDPCKDSNLGTKLTKLKKAIEDKIKGDNSGDDPLATQFDRNFYLEFKEGTGPEFGYVVAYVSGAIQGEKNFKKLADFIEDFVKKGCKIKVVYRATTKLTTADTPDGFEWCESPLIACPGGFCAETCPLADSIPKTNTNSANSNANANANANSNSNGSRSP